MADLKAQLDEAARHSYLLWLYLPWLYGRIYYGYTYFVQARGMAVEQERQVRNSSTTFSVVAVA